MSETSNDPKSTGCGPWSWLLFAGLGVVAWLLLTPGLVTPPEAIYLRECKQNLKTLGLALHNYHDNYRSFPPAIIRDEKNRPHLSWRTVLLPFVEQGEWYDKYKQTEPWNSPHNSNLLTGSLEVFRCPANKRDPRLPTTNYVAVIGPNTAWRSDGTVVSLQDITDGASHTILLVETKEADIYVFEPRDLSLDQMMRTVNPQFGQGVSSEHRLNHQSLGTHVLLADGTVRLLRDDISAELLYALLTINGGETIPDGW